MENKTGITSLAGRMSENCDKPKKLCEDFIKEMFKVCADSLMQDETVRIKGFGSFKIIESEAREIISVNNGERKKIDSQKKVVFTPSKELSEYINSPFDIFETLEINEEMKNNKDDFYILNEDESLGNENLVNKGILEEGSVEEGEDDEITVAAYTENKIENQPIDIDDKKLSINDNQISDSTYHVTPFYPAFNEEQSETYGKKKYGRGFITGALSMLSLCLIVFMLGCFFNWWPTNFGTKDKDNELMVNEVIPIKETTTDNFEGTETEPVEGTEGKSSVIEETPKVYDTVTTTRYLTTIAREHYGDFNFWPYIYEENSAILGHPDRITPGTKVVVPLLSKYGVDTKNKADVEKAKKKGLEIYSRYR